MTIRRCIVIAGVALACRVAWADSPKPNDTALHAALGIPSSMATIKEIYLPGSDHRLHYVLIEDIHGNPEAQGKIAAILLYAHHHWGSQQAFVEGAFGPIGPPPFPIFTVERGERSANELLRRGFFSGGELAAALASQSPADQSPPFDVIGMDDPVLYRQQLGVYEELLSLRGPALRRLEQWAPRLRTTDVKRLRLLLELRLTPPEYQIMLTMRGPAIADPLLARAVARSEVYYQLTESRSEHFAQRTRQRVGNSPCLLVMGGFHSPAICRALRERGESYLVLSPQVTERISPALYQQSLFSSLEALHEIPSRLPAFSPVAYLRHSILQKQLARATD